MFSAKFQSAGHGDLYHQCCPTSSWQPIVCRSHFLTCPSSSLIFNRPNHASLFHPITNSYHSSPKRIPILSQQTTPENCAQIHASLICKVDQTAHVTCVHQAVAPVAVRTQRRRRIDPCMTSWLDGYVLDDAVGDLYPCTTPRAERMLLRAIHFRQRNPHKHTFGEPLEKKKGGGTAVGIKS